MKMLSLNTAIKALTLAAVCGLLTVPASAATDTTTAAPADHAGPGMRHRGPGGPGFGGRGGPDADDLIGRLDTNKDSKVSLEEFLAPRLDRVDNMFERRDDNNDGVITEGEGRPQRPALAERGKRGEGRGPGGNRPPARPEVDRADVLACIKKAVPGFTPPAGPDGDDETPFEAADTNNDGKLTLAEVTAAETTQAKTQFSKRDTNGDGFITAAEVDAQRAERAKVAAAMRDCMKSQ